MTTIPEKDLMYELARIQLEFRDGEPTFSARVFCPVHDCRWDSVWISDLVSLTDEWLSHCNTAHNKRPFRRCTHTARLEDPAGILVMQCERDQADHKRELAEKQITKHVFGYIE